MTYTPICQLQPINPSQSPNSSPAQSEKHFNKIRKITLVDRKKGKQGEYNLAEAAVGGKVDIVVNNEVAQDGRARSPRLRKYTHARWTWRSKACSTRSRTSEVPFRLGWAGTWGSGGVDWLERADWGVSREGRRTGVVSRAEKSGLGGASQDRTPVGVGV